MPAEDRRNGENRRVIMGSTFEGRVPQATEAEVCM